MLKTESTPVASQFCRTKIRVMLFAEHLWPDANKNWKTYTSEKWDKVAKKIKLFACSSAIVMQTYNICFPSTKWFIHVALKPRIRSLSCLLKLNNNISIHLNSLPALCACTFKWSKSLPFKRKLWLTWQGIQCLNLNLSTAFTVPSLSCI